MARRLLEYLASPLDAWIIEYRVHAVQRMFKRYIEDRDVSKLLAVGIDSDSHRLYVIAIYEPDPDKWSENFTKRVSL
jgi:hypothetical protein